MAISGTTVVMWFSPVGDVFTCPIDFKVWAGDQASEDRSVQPVHEDRRSR